MSLLVAVAATAAAYAVANAQPAATAGVGVSAISGYEITGIGYDLAPSDPRHVELVRFAVAPATATMVRASIDGERWYSCEITGGSAVCETPGAMLASASSLQIVAGS